MSYTIITDRHIRDYGLKAAYLLAILKDMDKRAGGYLQVTYREIQEAMEDPMSLGKIQGLVSELRNSGAIETVLKKDSVGTTKLVFKLKG